MKQTCKKITGLFLALIFAFGVMVVPAQAATLDETTKASLTETLSYFLELLTSSSQEDMETLADSAGSTFFASLVDKFYETQEEAGAYQACLSTEVEDNGDGETATITMEVQFEQYTATISVTGNYVTASTATSIDEIFSAVNINVNYPMSELLKQAGMNTLIGIGIVFVMLVFLSFVISLFKYVNKAGATTEKPAAPAPKPVAAPVVPAVQTSVANTMSDEEMAVVLSLAIAAYEEENGKGDDYVVRSIKKVGRKTWKRA